MRAVAARSFNWMCIPVSGLNSASATTAQQLRLSNYGSATTAQQPRLSNQTRFSLQQLRFSNYGSATKIYSRFSNQTSATKTHPLRQVHALSHLPRHIKIPPPLASTCTVSSSTSYQNPTPSGTYMHSLIFHVISKSHPLWQVHAQSHLTRNLKIPPLWQVHAQSHFTRHIKIPPPVASTCTVSPYTSYQNPTPSGNYKHSLILHVISKSHPLWQVHAYSHLPRHIKIPPPLASTCTVSSYTSSKEV